jgi:ubiquinone/menaquinone biosynthesis C-methylase UbiE
LEAHQNPSLKDSPKTLTAVGFSSPGQLVNGVRRENATQLTFEDNSLDHILSFDVFEHVPSYLLAFKECYRTLRDGGTLMWSVPMARKKA